MKTNQTSRARAFHDLHSGKPILLLPNAWDAASARIFEAAGARAIATSSAGLANAQGYPDGEKLPLDLLLVVVRRICETVDVPVTVDLEAGYGTNGPEVAAAIERVLDAGAVGVNLEDRMLDPGVLVEKIGAGLEASRRKGVALFVNARTDVYLRASETPEKAFAEALRRLRIYQDAGAHGLFAPGLAEAETIRRLVGEIRLPLNVMAFPGVPLAKDLERLGVARVSLGGGPMRATMGLVARIAKDVLENGRYDSFSAGAMPNGEANKLFAR